MTTTMEQEPTVKAKVTTPGDRDIRIERIFNAPRDRVWKAMTDPKLVAQWWGRGNKLVIEQHGSGAWRTLAIRRARSRRHARLRGPVRRSHAAGDASSRRSNGMECRGTSRSKR